MHTKSIENKTFEIAIRIEIPSDEGDFLERLKTRIQLSVPSIIELR
jgi:hypothetical protein